MADKNVLTFTNDNWLAEVEQSSVPVVVDFWAPWCGPCRLLGPTIDKLAEQFVGRVKVGKLNIDEAGEIATRYRIASIPRIFIFHGGDQPKKMFTGVTSERELATAINGVLEAGAAK